MDEAKQDTWAPPTGLPHPQQDARLAFADAACACR
jgi:hypothetical protein